MSIIIYIIILIKKTETNNVYTKHNQVIVKKKKIIKLNFKISLHIGQRRIYYYVYNDYYGTKFIQNR